MSLFCLETDKFLFTTAGSPVRVGADSAASHDWPAWAWPSSPALNNPDQHGCATRLTFGKAASEVVPRAAVPPLPWSGSSGPKLLVCVCVCVTVCHSVCLVCTRARVCASQCAAGGVCACVSVRHCVPRRCVCVSVSSSWCHSVCVCVCVCAVRAPARACVSVHQSCT